MNRCIFSTVLCKGDFFFLHICFFVLPEAKSYSKKKSLLSLFIVWFCLDLQMCFILSLCWVVSRERPICSAIKQIANCVSGAQCKALIFFGRPQHGCLSAGCCFVCSESADVFWLSCQRCDLCTEDCPNRSLFLPSWVRWHRKAEICVQNRDSHYVSVSLT